MSAPTRHLLNRTAAKAHALNMARVVKIRHNSPVCQRCLDIESRLELDYHRDSHGAEDWIKRAKIRQRQREVSPYDPSLFGHTLPT